MTHLRALPRLAAILALVLAFAACSGEAVTTDPGDATTTVAADTDMDAEPEGGSVRIGAETWDFVPTIQCSVFEGGPVAIAGSADGDPSVEIVFDRFEDGELSLRVSTADSEWTAADGDFEEVSVEGSNVAGTATVREMSGLEAEAEFTFSC